MARCIQCTRCVRFGQEIAGVMELGMIGRGEHSEIVAFVGRGVDSELSGNMIDICPVGALTSKPFRYAARTWELARRRAVSPHDSLGSNLIVQAKGDRVLRVVPFDNPAVNECWISDKDRFSYEALASGERLTVADGQGRRRVEERRLADRAGGRRAGPEGRRRQARRRRAGHADLAARDAGGDGARRAAHPRAWLGQRRFSAAAVGFPRRRAGRRHPLARHADRRSRRAGARARRGQLPAQGPPARRAAVAPGESKGRGDLAAAFGRGRLPDPPRAFVRRGALAAAACAGRNRRRRGAGRGQAGAARARRHRAGRRGSGDCREPAVGRAQGDPARKFRRAARRGVAAAGARAGAVRHRRRAARLPDRGREQCRRPRRRRAAALRCRTECAGRCSPMRARPISCWVPKPSSTAPIRSRRAARSSRPNSSW